MATVENLNLIDSIKEIISEYGSFCTAEVEAEYSPTVNNQKGNLSHLIEYFNLKDVEVFVYGNWENPIDNYTLSYEELDYETLEYILELAQKYELQQIELSGWDYRDEVPSFKSMAKIEVTLTFIYDTEEDVSDWNTAVNGKGEKIKFIKTLEDAEATAYSELENNSPYDFTLRSNWVE